MGFVHLDNAIRVETWVPPSGGGCYGTAMLDKWGVVLVLPDLKCSITLGYFHLKHKKFRKA